MRTTSAEEIVLSPGMMSLSDIRSTAGVQYKYNSAVILTPSSSRVIKTLLSEKNMLLFSLIKLFNLSGNTHKIAFQPHYIESSEDISRDEYLKTWANKTICIASITGKMEIRI